MKNILSPIFAIAGSPTIAKRLSERFSKSSLYFAIMEEPWTQRHDAENEVKSRNNLLAYFDADHEWLILAGCSEKTLDMFKTIFSPAYWQKRIIVIKNENEIDKLIAPLVTYAVNEKQEDLLISHRDIFKLTPADTVAVIESSNSLGEIIALNLSRAKGYKILKVNSPSREEVDEFEDLLRDWNSGYQIARDNLFLRLRDKLGSLEKTSVGKIIFFTRGLPYGVLPFKCPVAHMMQERDLGLQILRGIWRENKQAAIATAFLCDPGHFEKSEFENVKNDLEAHGVSIIALHGKDASNHRFIHTIEWYPYDFALISSHAGEVRGRKITEEFDGSDGKKHEIIYDLFASFSGRFIDGKTMVQEMTVPISIDGIRWGENKVIPPSVLKDYFFERQEDRLKRKPKKTEACSGVKYSNALQMHDFTWIPAMQIVGEERHPIIFNNACASWLQMGGLFVWAGASAYIGTSKNIAASMAKECSEKFVHQSLRKGTILQALHNAQKEYATGLGYSPYLFWGFPDLTMSSVYVNSSLIRRRRITRSIAYWQRQELKLQGKEKTKYKAIHQCLEEVDRLTSV